MAARSAARERRPTRRRCASHVAGDVLVAASGGDKFESGSMLRNRTGNDRVRSMVNDVCDALADLKGAEGLARSPVCAAAGATKLG